MKFLDPAAKRSRARVARDGARAAERLNIEASGLAKRLGHHGPETLARVIRERMHVAVTREWAADLCRANGWKGR